MNWLKDDIGFEGWRFDFVKGYAPEFMQDYCGKTVGNDAWNVGEYWADLRLVTANNANDQCLITACAWRSCRTCYSPMLQVSQWTLGTKSRTGGSSTLHMANRFVSMSRSKCAVMPEKRDTGFCPDTKMQPANTVCIYFCTLL